MKSVILLIISCFFLSNIAVYGQSNIDKLKRPSPPAEVKAKIDNADISINYSSPAVKGRQIWGGLVPYGKIWRTGANEATAFETSQNILINGQELPAGKYALFTIPGETQWTFVFNSVWDQWGSFKYDQAKDVLRVDVAPKTSSTFNERMKFEVSDNNVVLLWENLQIILPVKA